MSNETTNPISGRLTDTELFHIFRLMNYCYNDEADDFRNAPDRRDGTENHIFPSVEVVNQLMVQEFVARGIFHSDGRYSRDAMSKWTAEVRKGA